LLQNITRAKATRLRAGDQVKLFNDAVAAEEIETKEIPLNSVLDLTVSILYVRRIFPGDKRYGRHKAVDQDRTQQSHF
jgi:hypothetical protein